MSGIVDNVLYSKAFWRIMSSGAVQPAVVVVSVWR